MTLLQSTEIDFCLKVQYLHKTDSDGIVIQDMSQPLVNCCNLNDLPRTKTLQAILPNRAVHKSMFVTALN
ncbi:hypothetical protein GP2143_13091 [marine gamma proteobacterium HTCC2143]|uniref:Uncharacterized protein n=1 Tax=marine gamma proteobacterium HTCC2143 TaxID=247633 RepID=A0Y7T8_9GAMM|nr:hypothetical protein GP2143_13091 [marine gamma proteobacterium HTCC2143]